MDGTADGLVAALRAAGCVFAEDEAALLRAAPGPLAELVARRVGGEPLETVLGWVAFGDLRLAVAPGVFVPRRRTELLARLTVAAARAGDVVVELCCGVAPVATTVAAARPDVVVRAADLDPAAVDVARRNLAPWPSAVVGCGDLFAGLPVERRDVVAANAPYVPTDGIATMPPEARDHEPRLALDGGRDGLDVARRVVAAAAGARVVLIETSGAQASVLAAVMGAAGRDVTVDRDDEVDGTVVVGRFPGRR